MGDVEASVGAPRTAWNDASILGRMSVRRGDMRYSDGERGNETHLRTNPAQPSRSAAVTRVRVRRTLASTNDMEISTFVQTSKYRLNSAKSAGSSLGTSMM
jgi:hypothetical protein